MSWKIIGISFLGPSISFCLKTRNILLVIEKKYVPKRLSHLLVKVNLNWLWKSYGKVVEFSV